MDICTGEEKLVVPVKAWHALSSADDSLFVFDENITFYRGCPSRVRLYNVNTGNFVYIVTYNPPLAAKEEPSKYHIDPHPRFNTGERYITFSTSINGRTDVAVAVTQEILPLTL